MGWLLAGAAAIAALVVAMLLGVVPRRTLRAAVEIDAPAERVWRILTEFGAYAEWNPFIVRGRGEARRGARLELTFRAGATSMVFRPVVLAAEPERQVRWLGRLLVPGLFDGEHGFTLEPMGARGVRVVQREEFRGLLVPFAGALLADTGRGFAALNQALKARAEAGPGPR